MFTKIVNFCREKKEDFKARRRGERRVAPSGARGRVYARPDEEQAGGEKKVKLKATVVLNMAITRADGTIEHRSVPATMVENPNG